ncbi:MAG: hypothetical protein H7070_13425 [Saprospiraceae bacterium]|nr:hypothetical protein [Pyrinomonadaceae bacterium]
MKEAIVILVVLLILVGLTAFRYRKQLMAMVNVWRMLKSMRQAGRQREDRIEGDNKASGPLVNCAKCGKWVPEDRAIKLGRTSFYCTAGCMEKSAKPA